MRTGTVAIGSSVTTKPIHVAGYVVVLIAVGLFSVTAAITGACARTVKVGLLLPISGPLAEFGERMKQGVDLALQERAGKVGADSIELVIRDSGDASLQRVRQLAQELVVREHVEFLGGLDNTPAVLSVADVVNQAKIPFVIFNSGTTGITKKSDYFVRAGFTQWIVSNPFGKRLGANGRKRVVIAVADFVPGYDAAAAFTAGLSESGGSVVETLKVPLGTSDPSGYIQKILELSPDSVFMFFPAGPFQVNFVKDFLAKGLRERGIELFGTGEMDEKNLKLVGPKALGMETAFIYGADLDNEKNRWFVNRLRTTFGANIEPHTFHVQAYDGMQVIFHMIEDARSASGGEGAIASAKGFTWNSPRGPVSIDPDTREIVQKVYLRRVVDDGGRLVNRAIDDFGMMKPPAN